MGDRMLTDLKVETLLERVGSKEPVPGGGSCSALAGAGCLFGPDGCVFER